jgi:methionyl-tRNA formyltransferase
MLKLWKVCVTGEEDNIKAEPGQIRIKDNAFFIGTSDSPLQILEMQLEGKKRMPASDFIRGTAITDGTYTE